VKLVHFTGKIMADDKSVSEIEQMAFLTPKGGREPCCQLTLCWRQSKRKWIPADVPKRFPNCSSCSENGGTTVDHPPNSTLPDAQRICKDAADRVETKNDRCPYLQASPLGTAP